MEATLLPIRPNRIPIPITVGVGHTSAIVSAGLAATVARMPGCQVRQWETTPGACVRNCCTPAHLIFGDSALLQHCREKSKYSLKICSFDRARFVWVTARTDPLADAAGDVAERLSIDCTEEEVFATVQRFTGSVRGAPRLTASASVQAIRPIAGGGLGPAALRRVCEHIEQHLAQKMRSRTLAAIAGLSPGHFNRAFKQSMGLSPHQYLVQRRVAAATRLLEKTDHSLADVALEAGFASQSHFGEIYLVATGETPGAYRRKYR